MAIAAELGGDTIKAKILAAKIFNEEREITANFDNPVIRINISSPYAESEKDKKINAVLIAKSVFPLSKDAMRVRVRFFPQGQYVHYDQITVTIADVKYFADGKETPDALIKSIDIESGSEPSNPVPSTNPVPANPLPSHPLLTRLQTRLNITPVVSPTPVLANPTDMPIGGPPGPPRFVQDSLNKAKTNALYGRLLSIAKAFRVLELAGVNTAPDSQRLGRLVLDLSKNRPNVAQDATIMVNILRQKGYDRFAPPPALPGAVDRLHWQDTIASLSSTIRTRLGSDTPDLDGLNLGERVRVATLIHALADRGHDVTAWRRRLLEIDGECEQTTNPEKISQDIETLEHAMGF
jgi:hypothetical protein